MWGDRAHWKDRPIREFVAWWGVAWGAFVAALWIGRRLPARVPALALLLAIAALARAALFGTNPIQEDDAYRYLWDGRQVLAGVNPYVYTPEQVNFARLDPDAPADLRRLRDTLDDPSARKNFDRINNARVPSVYPPLNQLLFAASQKLAPWSLDGLRAWFLALELATIGMIWFALRAAGANPMWAAIYAWCPLTIKEMANSPHHDALVVAALSLFLLLIVTGKPRSAAAALAAAVAAKLYPVVLLPVLLAFWWRRDRRAAVHAAAAFAATLILLYAPFLHPAMFRGTGVFASEWASNAGAFGLLEAAGNRIFGFEEYPTPLGGRSTHGALYARILCAALIAGGVGFAALQPRFVKPGLAPAGRPWELPFRCLVALSFGFAFSPTQHPWYFAGILPFVALFPFRSWILATGLLSLYYLRFWLRYHFDERQSLALFDRVRLFEWIPFYAVLFREGFRALRAPHSRSSR